MSSTRCVLDVSTSRFVLLLGSCASSWRAPRASSWRAPRERASMKNDGMMIIIIGARGRVFGFATKPTSLAVARRPVHSRVPTRLPSQPAQQFIQFIFIPTSIRFVHSTWPLYLSISISAACRPKAKHAVPAPWNARPLPHSLLLQCRAGNNAGWGRFSLECGSTRPQSKIQSSSTLRCCDPLPALLAGAAGVVCPTAGSRTGRALSRAPPLDPYALKAVGILSVPDTTTPAFLNC